jgi:predicted HD phosphohydrolase
MKVGSSPSSQVGFRSFSESTAEDWRRLTDPANALSPPLPERLVAQLRQLDGDTGGFPVTRLEHCLQTATRAHRAGRDEEYVVCALLHDIGDLLCPANHADMAAAIVRPYVSEEVHWVVAHHTIFQGYYYFHHIGLDRDMREAWRGHPYFESAVEFCERFDQVSFDPGYTSMPLEAFAPMLARVLASPKHSIFAPAGSGQDGRGRSGSRLRRLFGRGR